MYRKQPARAAGAAVLLSIGVIAACSRFQGEPPGTPDAGGHEAGDASGVDAAEGAAPDGGVLTDAGPADGAIIVGETIPVASVSCNGTTCALGDGCCFGDAGPVCAAKGACAGFFLACLTPATCGSANVCCFDGTRSACAASCGGGGGVCQVGSECATGVCGPVKCAVDGGAPIVPFSLCSDTTVVPAIRGGVTCAR